MVRCNSSNLIWPARRVAGRLSSYPLHRQICLSQARTFHADGRERLSNMWIPSGSYAASNINAQDAHSKLIQAGFIRQTHSGVFQMLPLGLRVQDKIERLIDKHMRTLGASKLALSLLSAQSLWEKSGRLQNGVSELFRLTDRKGQGFLLCPTHEEEITSLVAKSVTSYKETPLKLYQITRKYRDELRPRHGLLRGREFVMKDLYTFDISVQAALKSYEEVQVAYRDFFAELRLPVLVAKASSGDMGGDLSHEYHLPTAIGEDKVVSCTSCDYVANEELAEVRAPEPDGKHRRMFRITEDRSTLVNVWYPESADGVLDIQAVKALVPDLDVNVTDPSEYMRSAKPGSLKVINLIDGRLQHITQFLEKPGLAEQAAGLEMEQYPQFKSVEYVAGDKNGKLLNFLKVAAGGRCPKCEHGTLKVQEAIELGHTFYLGTRYSKPLEARVEVPKALLDGASLSSTTVADTEKQSEMVALQMGCHGIGVTRLIGAVADHLQDKMGLNWPFQIAPYEVVVLTNGLKPDSELVPAAESITDLLAGYADVVLDDRPLGIPWKVNDADLVGYPIIVVIGKYWTKTKEVEVKCRRLGVTELVMVERLTSVVEELLLKLQEIPMGSVE